MIAFTGFLAVALIAMLLAPDTDFARLCRAELVERPAGALAKFRSHHLLYAVILIPVMLSGGEFIVLLGPEFFAAYAMELAIYFDAVILSLMMSAGANIRAAAGRAKALVGRPLRMARARRKRSVVSARAKTAPANDDDRPGDIALAA